MRARSSRVNAGISYIEDVESDRAGRPSPRAASGRPRIAAALRDCDAILICLPTPLDEHRNPDLSYVIAGAEMAAANLGPDALVVLESTTYPGHHPGGGPADPRARPAGSVGDGCLPRLQPGARRPGQRQRTASATRPRWSAASRRSAPSAPRRSTARICEKVHVVSTPESAEMAKILENTFRAVNIALVNEMAILSDRMGIDIWESIGAASTKPFGFMPFWPGPGPGRPLHPDRPVLPDLAGQGLRPLHRVRGAGRAHQHEHALLRGPAGHARAQSRGPGRERRPRSCCWAWPTSPTSATCARARR